jgi:rhodanese-related sulfurtransferase
MPAVRINPEEAYRKVKSGGALLVCAYDDEATYQTMRLDMAISLGEFQKRLPGIPKEKEIIFYCA